MGKSYEPVAFEITSDRVDAFHDLFGGPPGVPPTLFTAAEFTVFPHVIGDPELALDFRKVVHGTQEYEVHRPPAIGETLHGSGADRVDPGERAGMGSW